MLHFQKRRPASITFTMSFLLTSAATLTGAPTAQGHVHGHDSKSFTLTLTSGPGCYPPLGSANTLRSISSRRAAR
jgi:hypothetical protein